MMGTSPLFESLEARLLLDGGPPSAPADVGAPPCDCDGSPAAIRATDWRQARPVEPSGMFTGRFTGLADADFRRFNLTERSRFELQLGYGRHEADVDLFKIIDDERVDLVGAGELDYTAGADALRAALPPGDYLIRIQHEGPSNRGYHLTYVAEGAGRFREMINALVIGATMGDDPGASQEQVPMYDATPMCMPVRSPSAFLRPAVLAPLIDTSVADAVRADRVPFSGDTALTVIGDFLDRVDQMGFESDLFDRALPEGMAADFDALAAVIFDDAGLGP